jgi:hypothetical protein
MEYLGSCYELAIRLNIHQSCCDSCHEDEDYDLSEAEFENGYYDCCCIMKEKFNIIKTK